MNTQKQIFEKLSKQNFGSSKQSLSSNTKRIALGLVDDIKQDAEFLDEQIVNAIYYGDERFDTLIEKVIAFQNEISNEVDNLMINTSVNSIIDLAADKLPMIQKLESVAMDLGVLPTELYSEYEWLNGNVMNAKDIMRTFYTKYDELVQTAGFLTDFSR